jgi:hypothetical protein
MVAATRSGGTSAPAVEVVVTTNTNVPVFSGKHGNDWTIWEMKMTAHLMDKGLDVCLEQDFESKLPLKEIGKGNRLIHSGLLEYQSFKQGQS